MRESELFPQLQVRKSTMVRMGSSRTLDNEVRSERNCTWESPHGIEYATPVSPTTRYEVRKAIMVRMCSFSALDNKVRSERDADISSTSREKVHNG